MSSTAPHPKQLLSKVQDPRTSRTLDILTPTNVMDDPRVEDAKDATKANVEPTDVQYVVEPPDAKVATCQFCM